jgi:phosphoenolpyruvate carboxykinase (ATP)
MTTIDRKTLARFIKEKAGKLTVDAETQELSQLSSERLETRLTAHGALVAHTGRHTGRSAKDKYIVRDATTADTVWWDNSASMNPDQFDALLVDMIGASSGLDMQEQNLVAGADPRYRLGIRVFTPSAWHALFIRHLLIRPTADELESLSNDVTILHLPDFEPDSVRHNLRSSTAIALDLTRNIVLIAGTHYAGEIKKSVFSLFNFHAPEKGVLPMHCSANVGEAGDTALFFGLSGTGKTTLSTDPTRQLIGDDEHGWSDNGVFNLEGGCYAKTIKLSRNSEPEIFAATETEHTILENVIVDEATGLPGFDDTSLTENTRAAYPLYILDNIREGSMGPTPRSVVFLTADAFGVMPPLARLSHAQAVYHFLSGYTAKVAGTEVGVTEPQATFSACYGAPFMARHPMDYAHMLQSRLRESGARCWLVNTGWVNGPYGVGERISIRSTRRLLNAALTGELNTAEVRTDPVFGFGVPIAVEGIDTDLLDPRSGWSDPNAYDEQARKLVELFNANAVRLGLPPELLEGAGPILADAAE